MTIPTTSTRKVRRDAFEGKRAQGHELQLRHVVRRADPTRIATDATDASLTGCAGLVGFGQWVRRVGAEAELHRHFGHLKKGLMVVYPMVAQMRLLMDLQVVGQSRVFGLEAMAADPLFVRLAGGHVPSIDVLYDDLARFGDDELEVLGAMVSEHGLAPLRELRPRRVHLDIDTTVEAVFGEQIEGAVPGPNPRYRGRPSYHPMLATIAETGTLAGIALRPGDTGFGADDVPLVVRWVQRVRHAVGPDCVIVVRIDAAGDCAALLKALEDEGVHYVIKARLDWGLRSAISRAEGWSTVDRDADGAPTRQIAEVRFERESWHDADANVRVLALRERDAEHRRRVFLWADMDWTTSAVLTNAAGEGLDALEEIVRTYNGRAEVEPLIADLKGAWGIGKIPTQRFGANAAMLLIKALAYNLFTRYVAAKKPELAVWRTPWKRRVVIAIPGRLLQSGRQWTLRVPPAARWLN